MPRRALVPLTIVGAFVLSSCAGVTVRSFRSSDRTGVVDMPLCAVCSSPYEWQVRNAHELIAKKCGGRSYSIEEEGLREGAAQAYYSSQGNYSATEDRASGSYSTSAGTTQKRYQYLVFRCD